MSFDLAVWEGARPADDRAATKEYLRRMEERDASEEVANRPPTPAIRAFVDALLAQWPDLTEVDEDDARFASLPWADGPLIDNAWGDTIYFAMKFSAADEAAPFAATVAQRLGLVCYDPQREALI